MPNPRGINQYSKGRGTKKGGPIKLKKVSQMTPAERAAHAKTYGTDRVALEKGGSRKLPTRRK